MGGVKGEKEGGRELGTPGFPRVQLNLTFARLALLCGGLFLAVK